MIYIGKTDISSINVQTYIEAAQRVIKRGRSYGSLEPEETAGLDYSVITGDVIAARFPELQALAAGLALQARAVFGSHYELTDSSKRVCNINVLQEGQRYEKHVDGNELTGLIYLNDNFSGGALMLSNPDVQIPITAGLTVIFKAGEIPHEVTPVGRGVRVCLNIAMDSKTPSGVSSLETDLYTGGVSSHT